ncbi:conserved hypothetical protein [Methanocaldococcus infernus ME]|uniref:Uncharacterized protein n=1 Tax=Methanocaldococcus infernus (strain DSM 11812 / JCM 15783 / ME) TaxID=573063 RepID=D5VTY4_METIM|nr:HVO_0476 family zinc finger protein [Methanocaldococcus infernus]ADG14037.1 conserved hypothetical protein [Methanocaldococcus infernus ME]
MEKIYDKCEICGNEEFEVLKKRESNKYAYYLVRCLNCGHVKEIEDKVKLSQAKLIISREDKSEAKMINLIHDVEYKVGDEIEVDGETLRITKIEVPESVNKAKGEEIKYLWTKSLSAPKKIGISINDRGKTYSIYLIVPPDFEFEVDKVYKVNEGLFKIKKIKTEKGDRRKAKAIEIKRIYGDPVKFSRSSIDLTEYLKDIKR